MKKCQQDENYQLEQFFMNLCHDLKSPLQAMLGFNAMNRDKLQEIIPPPLNKEDEKVIYTFEQINRNMDIISIEGARLTSMIDNLLDMYLMDQGIVCYNIEPCQTDRLVEEISSLMRSICETKNMKWNINCQENLPPLLLDRHWILRALENLLSNAVKFTEEGSISCQLEKQGGMVRFTVADTGKGIPLKYHNQVFEKFVKVPDRRNQKGTGLGLAITKNIVENHGGEIWLESWEGNGTRFSFTVPTA